MSIPWAKDMSRFTTLFESFAIIMLKASKNRSKTAESLRLSWDEINHIMANAVKRGLARRKEETIEYIGIDEKSFLSGHSYVTVMTDHKKKRIIDVVQNRDTEAVNTLWERLSKEQRNNVKAVTMDFWQAYINGATDNAPQAEIVHDKFHIMKYLNESVDKVRRKEQKALKAQNEEVLTGTKYLWLKNKGTWTKEDKTDFKDLKNEELDVSRAWIRKELFQHFWDFQYEKSARKFFKAWYFSATHSRLGPVIEVAKMIKRHLEQIITYLKYRITNAFAEGMNSLIQHIKATARGFRNFANYRISILFYCGGLELNP
jgi:transposase